MEISTKGEGTMESIAKEMENKKRRIKGQSQSNRNT